MVWRQIAEPEGEKQISSRRAWLFVLMAGGIGLDEIRLFAADRPAAADSRRRIRRIGVEKAAVTAGVIAAGVAGQRLWSSQTPGLDMVANGISQ